MYSSIDREDSDALVSVLENTFTGDRDLTKNIYALTYEINAFQNKFRASLFGKYYQQETVSIDPEIATGPDGNNIIVDDIVKSTTTNEGYGFAASYAILPNITLLASAEKAIRLPNETEIFGNDGDNVVANPTIKPEQSDNYNLGFRLGAFNFRKHQLTVSTNFFSRNIKNLRISNTIKLNGIASASPKIMHAYIKKNVWFKGFKMTWSFLKFQRTMNLKKKRYFDNQYLNKIVSTDAICGCCSIYKANILKKSGLGDEDFFYGPEDIELSHRLKKYGRLVCDQKIKTFHKIARSAHIAEKFERTFESTYGFLILIKKIGTFSDKLFGYAFFILRGFLYFLIEKNDEKKNGYKKALIRFFLKDAN